MITYKGYIIEVQEKNGMIRWAITRTHDKVKMTSDSEFGNYNTVASVTNDLKTRIDKWINIPMNKKK